MRIAGYPRVSTDEQAEQGYSIDEQIETMQKWCKDNGYPPAVITPYIDDGYSAKDLRRPGLKLLLADVKEKKYDIVITTKLNRLSRRLYDILGLIDFFEKNNCNYASARESFDTSTYVGRMQMQMLGLIAEFERERIAEDVRNTMKSIARKSGDSKKAFTVPCFGYDVIEGMYQINVEEALILDKAADLLIAGKGNRAAAIFLNGEGVTGKMGAKFTDVTVSQLMRRETLKGQLVYNRTYKKNRKTYTRPQEEWIIIDDHHPAIFDEKKWNDIQKAMDTRKIGYKQADNERWLLSGLVVCGNCGSKMMGQSYKKTTKKKQITTRYFNYICSSYHKHGECTRNALPRDELEQYVIDDIKKTAKASNVNKLKLVVSAPKTSDDERTSINDQLLKLDIKMQRQIEAYEDELISGEDLKKARIRIDQKRDELTKRLESISIPNDQLNAIEANQNAKKHILDISSGDRLVVKNGIRQVIQKIEITDGESIKLVYHSI